MIAEAAALCAKQDFHLIVLDINLPDGSGFDFCQDIKQRRPDIAVIFLTAHDMESDMLRGFELGADDYVTKPFPISVFRKKVSALLSRIEKQNGTDCYQDGRLFIDFSGLSATLAEQPVSFTPLEYRLLNLLVKHGLGAGVLGCVMAAGLGLTILDGLLNSSSLWYFILRFTIVPALIVSLLYLVMAAVVPAAALHFFNTGTIVERLRITES